MTKHYFTYLALGDSYTVGESVPLHESFPYQTVQLLRKHGLHIHAPEIVAKTGWTTLDLVEHILHNRLNDSYDFVTLLIGVNNQYNGLLTDDYKTDFEFLLKKAIHSADDKPDRVIVLSIPDWSVTPFAKDRDTRKISEEIETFNQINKDIAVQYKVHYLDISASAEEAIEENSPIAADGLHPPGKEYSRWANAVADIIKKVIE